MVQNILLWKDICFSRLSHVPGSEQPQRNIVLSALHRANSWKSEQLKSPRIILAPNTRYLPNAKDVKLLRKNVVFLHCYLTAQIINTETETVETSWSSFNMTPMWAHPIDDDLIAYTHSTGLELRSAKSRASPVSIALPTCEKQLADISRSTLELVTSSGCIVDLQTHQIRQKFSTEGLAPENTAPIFSRFNDSVIYVSSSTSVFIFDVRAPSPQGNPLRFDAEIKLGPDTSRTDPNLYQFDENTVSYLSTS
jgi:hypothetical protein